MKVLGVILRLQEVPPIPLTFAEIFEQLEKENPSTTLTRTWVHRVLKSLVDAQLIRVENPTAHRKKYIADVNTIVAGLEQLKSQKVEDLETRSRETNDELTKVVALDCGQLSKQLIRAVTGRQEEVSSRIVRGVEELHRVLRYNMLDVAGKGDVIRATALWVQPFMDDETETRTRRFLEAAERGAEVKYLISINIFQLDRNKKKYGSIEDIVGFVSILTDMKERGKKFDVRLYAGPYTYNQISFNNDNMALVITENPVTATWMTRKFNPDLIDNAVKTFEKDWKKSKSILDMTPEDFGALQSTPED